jgi:very-short-patch-repair endonuclease
MLPYNKQLEPYSREQRKNMTDAEKLLWSKIRMRQLNKCQFYRQRIVGDYIVDFFCPRAKLIIEVDGSQPYSDKMAKADRIKDRYMGNCGFTVLRFNDNQVLTNTAGVTEKILEKMKARE